MKKALAYIILISSILSLQIANSKTIDRFTASTFSFKRIGQVVVSPDGKQTAFIIKELNKKNEKWNYLLYLKNDNNDYQLLNKNTHVISSPKWAPDGKQLAFLAPNKKFNSIWIVEIGSKKPHKIEYLNNILAFQWSPNGKYFAFLSTNKSNTTTAELINIENNYKNNQLFIMPVNGNPKLIKAITPNNISITQGFLLSGFDWSPDSSNITFTYQKKPGNDDPYQSIIGLIHLNKNEIFNLPYSDSHAIKSPSYSPNGNWIAFESGISLLSEKKGLTNNPYLNNQICVSNTKSFKTFCLGKTFNENSYILGWNQSSDGVFVVENYKTIGPRIYLLSIDSSAPKLISDINGFIDLTTLTLNNNHNYFGFRYETFTNPPEAYISKTNSFKLEQISKVQNPENILPNNNQVIHWKSNDNTIIEGLLITPPHFNKKKQYPLYVDIHGGPASTWVKRFVNGCDEHGDMFVPTSCTSNLLNLGFIIFQPNPRGSDGYGKKFRIANYADLGGKDYEDILTGVDYLIQQNIADPKQLVIAGWSYGGFMTAWAITQTNRFKLAIDGGGKTDMISFSGTTDMKWIQPQYFGVSFWDNSNLYVNHSAIFHVKNINTPILILHGENDKRVPLGQAYEFYNALKEQNKTVKMLISPNTDHAPTDPKIIASNIKEIDLWLKQM